MIPLTFIVFLKVVLMNVIVILLVSAKLATPNLLKKLYFEKSLWRHNFCPISVQLNFIKGRKLHCWCRYLTNISSHGNKITIILSIRTPLSRACRIHYLDSRYTSKVMIYEKMSRLYVVKNRIEWTEMDQSALLD